MSNNYRPRGWQIDAVREFEQAKEKSFLLDACPGAGKTMFSAFCAAGLINRGEIDFTVIVVPTTALKGDASGGFVCDWHRIGVEIKTALKDGKGVPKQFAGAVITYQQLPNIVSTFETWARNGTRLFFVFDEVHHASDTNVWGAEAESCAHIAKRVLCMTGTPFRGDGRRISFVRYDDEGKSISDFSYSYRQAVAERVCRPVEFIKDDSMTEYVVHGELNEVMVSEASPDIESKVNATLYHKDSEWMASIISKADQKLDEYRISDINAGGIVICRPGTDENDDRHLLAVADLVKKLTGEQPTVITHDDPDANAKIARFRKSSERWICAVRKISEGVDIKRLRVMVMATAPQTELLFRQLVGRVVRQEDVSIREDSSVYISSLPRLREFAQRLEDEAVSGLKTPAKPREREPGEQLDDGFMPVGATHVNDGAISHWGENFSAAEIIAAEAVKKGDRILSDISVTRVAHILRIAGVQPSIEASAPEPEVVRRGKKRKEINRLVRSVAYAIDGAAPDFKAVWTDLFMRFRVRSADELFDDAPIGVMDQCIDLLKARLSRVAA